ncbi:AAA family ATPase [Lysobacter capsici]|uniref:AAA family ATPase n=1 Tax=Lysobacter capsici TaxID=435897 RepID=UPI001C0019C2|nr:AAA family ATPase [Lysobacter capsici]MBW8807724.1 AAA family ATPase [Lysobacter sp.]QWF19145.1 AAA family ATPase [Lysobacter capsici]
MEIVLFIGAQGAGKSRFYLDRFFATHLRVNLDMLKTRHRERLLLRACFEMKQRFVVDNTNPTCDERAAYIAQAREHGFAVRGYYFDVPYDELLSRNAQREGKARVSEVAIRATLKRLQPPAWAEGFEQLHTVRVRDGGCIVTDYESESEGAR